MTYYNEGLLSALNTSNGKRVPFNSMRLLSSPLLSLPNAGLNALYSTSSLSLSLLPLSLFPQTTLPVLASLITFCYFPSHFCLQITNEINSQSFCLKYINAMII